MRKCKISVIVPVYNTANYLNQCLDSILNQTFTDFEIICINDGSTDASLDILNQYAQKDSRISLFSKEENEGQAKARNLGLSKAKGDYIAFVDSDDFIKEDMLEKLYTKANKHNLDITMCKVSLFDEETGKTDNNVWYYALGVFRNLKKDIFTHEDTKDFTCEISVTPVNKLYKKSLLDKNNIKFSEGIIFEDEVFFYDVYLRADSVSIVDDNLYYYRINREGSTVKKDKDKNYIDIVTAFKKTRDIFKETNDYESYKSLVANRFIHLALWRFSQTDKLYQKEFYQYLKDDLIELFEDEYIVNNLSSNIKSRALKIVNSKNFDEFKKLDQNKIFSIVMACYNVDKYISEAIESIIGQNFGFESNVQLILVDDGSTDKTSEFCLKYAKKYPENISYYYQDNAGQASARNFGLNFVTGKYVNFLDADDKLKPDTLLHVYNFFEKHQNEIDMVAVSMNFFGRYGGNHPLNYKFKKDKIVYLYDDYDYPQLSASSAFFKKDLFNDFKFDTTLVNSEDCLMVNKILLQNPVYGVIKEGNYLYRKRDDLSSTIDFSNKTTGFFIKRLKNYFLELINYSKLKYGRVLRFIQYTIVYDLQWMFETPEIEKYLNHDEIKEFYSLLFEIMDNLEDEVILALRNDKYNLRRHMLALKHRKHHTLVQNGKLCFYGDDTLIDVLNDHRLYWDIIEIRRGNLYLSGYVSSYFSPDYLSIKAQCGTIIFESQKIIYPNRDRKFLSLSYNHHLCFDFVIPLDELRDDTLEIYINYTDDIQSINIHLPFAFENHARLSPTSNYAVYDSKFLTYKDFSFIITNYNYFKMFKYEISTLFRIFSSKKPYYTSALAFRLVYLLLYPFIRHRRIWLFMDNRSRADDNGEVLFKYALTQRDDVNKYFTINETSPDFERLSSLKNVLPFYSIKQRLVYLFAEKIISSHPDENILNPFLGKNVQLYSGLITSEKIFLQHGITKDNISSWFRKYDKNVALIVTSSDMETDSFNDDCYNFDDAIIQPLGFPRFDNLKKSSSSKKQILIMPSWREAFHHKHEFLNSEYFKKINAFINNKRLIKIASDEEYRIIFRPHPNIFKYLKFFNINDYIHVDKTTTYKDLFNESSLLITDYSSVAFDFAYQKKPVIYYQFANDYNFDKGYFDYETMGFGEVIADENKLIDTIEYYLSCNCKMKEKYTKNVDMFFKFVDKNNSKRVYDTIYNLK